MFKKEKKKDDINFFISFDPSISMFCADDLRGASNHDFMFNYQVPKGIRKATTTEDRLTDEVKLNVSCYL